MAAYYPYLLLEKIMMQRVNFTSLIGREIFAGILLGGFPVFIAFWISGVEGIEKELSGLIPSEIVMWWSVVLTVFGGLLQALNFFKSKKTDFEESLWLQINKICEEISPSLTGILRMISGILIAFVCIWACKDWAGFDAMKAGYFMFIAFVSLAESAVLTQWIIKTRPRQSSMFH